MRSLRFFALLPAVCALAGAATSSEPTRQPDQHWPLSRLFTRPFLWGTPPSGVKWARESATLAFLWNSEGQPFLDLYAYDANARKLTRLTHLEAEPDEYNQPEIDERQKAYQLPQTGLSNFALSPDGKHIAYSYLGDLYLVDTDGAKLPFRLTRTKAAETNPQFSPDAHQLAYTRGGALLVQDLTTGQLRQIGSAENIAAYRWSPDGRMFVYSTRTPGATRNQVLPNYSGRFVAARPFSRDVAGDEPGTTKLFLIASDSDKATAVQAGPLGDKTWGFGLPEWSPDSKLLIKTVASADLKREQVLLITAASGRARLLYEEKDPAWAFSGAAGWSPDSKSIFFTSEKDGFAHLYTLGLDASAVPVQVTKGAWEVRSERGIYPAEPQWAGGYLYFTSTETSPHERQFFRVRPDGSGKERLTKEPGINIGIASDDGQHQAVMHADLDHPLDLYVDGHRVTVSERADFAKYPWPQYPLL